MNTELPLYKDQINSDSWSELCDYAFDEINEPWVNSKSNVVKFKDASGIGSSGIIYCRTNQRIEHCLKAIPQNGNYILIYRDNDKSITEEIYRLKPQSVKHWFTINCAVKHDDITAIPYGVAGIGGYSKTLENAGQQERVNGDKLIYARLNVPPEMQYLHERHRCLDALENNPLATVIWQPLDGETNFKYILQHPFVAAPIGTGIDCMRTWESVALGAIPILTDCAELRHFEDMPVIYTKDWIFEKEFLEIVMRLKYKSTFRARMSYWRETLHNKKLQYGIGLENG